MTASVSTIIPCYRCSDTIRRAVESVAKQTLLPAEVILVDDGSGDHTLDVLLQIQHDYDKDWLKVIALNDNQGASVARNTAWNLASQDYIAFLDADEVWHPEKIAVQYSWMIHHSDVALSGHDSVRIKPGTQVDFEPIPKDIQVNSISRNQILLSNAFSTTSVILKRLIKQRFHPALRYSQDYLLWLEIILNGGQAAVMEFPGAYYFKHLYGESGLTKNLVKLQENELEIYKILWNSQYINRMGWQALSLWSLVKHYRRLCICSIRPLKELIIHS